MKASICCLPSVGSRVDLAVLLPYNALVPHTKLLKSTEALWTKLLPNFHVSLQLAR